MNFVHARKHTRCVFFAAAHRVSRLIFFLAELLFGLTYCFFSFVSSHHFLSAHGSPTVSSLSDTDRWKIERTVATKRKSNIVQHQVLAITCDIREKTRAMFFPPEQFKCNKCSPLPATLNGTGGKDKASRRH